MNRKFLVSLASLLVISAFAVMPMAAQAEPHYYKNATLIKEGEKVQVLGWGKLTLTSAAGTVTCDNAATGFVENVATEGKGATQTFATYNCSTAACPLETRAEPYKLPWLSTLFLEGETTRSRSVGVEVIIGCWFGPPSGPGNVSTSERNTPAAELLPFAGESTPKSANGKTATKPSHVQFGAGSGELINGKVGGGKTTGETTLEGYIAQETITTGP